MAATVSVRIYILCAICDDKTSSIIIMITTHFPYYKYASLKYLKILYSPKIIIFFTFYCHYIFFFNAVRRMENFSRVYI